jgi:hypothetical protein
VSWLTRASGACNLRCLQGRPTHRANLKAFDEECACRPAARDCSRSSLGIIAGVCLCPHAACLLLEGDMSDPAGWMTANAVPHEATGGRSQLLVAPSRVAMASTSRGPSTMTRCRPCGLELGA